MVRPKIVLKKIEDVQKQRVTFSKRHRGLLKKAHELSILCDAEVGVIIFSSTGKLSEFASTSLNQIIERYDRSNQKYRTQLESDQKANMEKLRREVARLRSENAMLTGKNLEGLSHNKLLNVEQKLRNSLSMVQEMKGKVLADEQEASKSKEHRLCLENKAPGIKVEDLEDLVPSTQLVHPNAVDAERQPRPSSSSAEVKLMGVVLPKGGN